MKHFARWMGAAAALAVAVKVGLIAAQELRYAMNRDMEVARAGAVRLGSSS